MNQKSFTLIEILIVIVVIGTLSAFVLVGTSSISENASITKSRVFSNSLENSLLTSRVSQLKFNEGTGSTVQDSWLTNNFTFPGGTDNPDWVFFPDCISQSCLHFDAALNQYLIRQNFQTDIKDGFTIEGFINVESMYDNGGQILEYGWPPGDTSLPRQEISAYYGNSGGYEFIEIEWAQYDATNHIYAVYCTLENEIFPLNKWTHFVMSINPSGGIGRIYLNGQKKQVTNYLYGGTVPSNFYSLMNYDMLIGYGLDGMVDEIKIYNYDVPQAKIQQNYYSGLNNLLSKDLLDEEEYVESVFQLKQSISVKP
ncbi:MAG TPA: prepilin-type N-terminal cleavage/methylation domain-containing protein [Candidatus Pacearchaeota archaeon]|nr:prepilin-type N-terminal cleavage/methylation domain-containing protein [Candidatus Pacearchaeota archaeon]